jgi:VIT1/CCC1 family predicted Fe2+/Mn2+ transporter
LRNLHTWVTKQLDSYPTSIVDDKALQHEIGISDNIRNSIIVRKGEKEILLDVIAKLESSRMLMPDHDEL